jgi:dienelactone hydrolase
MKRTVAIVALLGALATASACLADPMDPQRQEQNQELSRTRSQDFTQEMHAQLAAAAARRVAERAAIHARDPERAPDPSLCPAGNCVGDPRLDGWAAGRGTVRPVLFTARDGATLSGHVWATRGGPRRRPGVVIINGSIVNYEAWHWFAAQALAKDGYVVFTFDAQGEGDSDQFGESPDQGESKIAGAPPLGDGGPFYDGGEDALDFFLSTPKRPYIPRPSRTSATSHADKQRRRTAAGLNAAYNPYWRLLDRSRIGLAGHSFGAYASSYLAQADPRVDAEVAWDPLCVPRNSTRSEAEALGNSGPDGPAKLLGAPLPTAVAALPGDECLGAPEGYAPDVPIRTPALGISNDYLFPVFWTDPPSHDFKARVSEAYSRVGVDSGQIVIRGGTHFEYAWGGYSTEGATLRGIDLVTWYTAAWFDGHLKREDPTAELRLMSNRWRDDARGQAVDPAKDANLLSEFYRSRMDIHTTEGARSVCEDLRAGCSNVVPAAQDCGIKDFGYLGVDRAPDDGRNPLLAPSCQTRARRAR